MRRRNESPVLSGLAGFGGHKIVAKTFLSFISTATFSPSLLTEAADVLNQRRDLIVAEPLAPRRHIGRHSDRRAAALDGVEDDLIGKLAHRGAIGEILRLGGKRGAIGTIALARITVA